MALPTQIKKLSPEFEKLPLKKLYIFSFFISLIVLIIGVATQFFLPPEIPLYYGLPQTSDQLAPSMFIILPSLLSIIITITNIFLSMKNSGSYLKRALAFTSISISILATITTYKIFFLVSSL